MTEEDKQLVAQIIENTENNTIETKKKPGRKKLSDEEKKARRNARDRKRYANDEEYRKKRLAKCKNHW